MPQKIFCRGCGAVLYEGLELESPHEIIQRYDGLCPKCHKPLLFDDKLVGFTSYETKK